MKKIYNRETKKNLKILYVEIALHLVSFHYQTIVHYCPFCLSV